MENSVKKIKLESENDFENSSESQQENFLTDQKVKKDPEGNFLFLEFESPKMPNSIKREVTRKEIKTTKKPIKFSKHQCQICQKYFSRRGRLESHVELHFQPSSFECKRCERIFELKHRFKAHKCVKKSEGHFCRFCKKNFSFAIHLRTHIKKFHAEKLKVNLFSCDFCDEKYVWKGNLKNHLESFQCRIQKIFTCDHCGKEFDNKTNLYNHILIHASNKVKCEICHVQVNLRRLKRHMKLVHESEKVECKICKKVLKNSKVFKGHMKCHENSEKFKCQICGHQTGRKSSLKLHLRIHDKNRERNSNAINVTKKLTLNRIKAIT
jgi:KRAB domain-containing zinc finger protein